MSDYENTLPEKPAATASRRDFLRLSAIGLAVPAGLSVLAACKGESAGGAAAGARGAANGPGTAAGTTATAGMAHDSDQSGGTNAPHPATPQDARAKADAMDAMHEKGIKSFPAKTAGKGNVLMPPRMEGGVKVFDVTAGKVMWEVEPGRSVEAFAYNGQVPGPQIRVREGDRVRLNLTNRLEQSTAVHFHGVELPNDQDGVPFITQPPIKPGQTYTYEFTAPNPGSHMYHSHHNSAEQVGKGLLGAFIIEPRRKRAVERVDVDYVLIMNDGYHGYTFNGKSFPATEPIVAKLGQKVRIRFMNEGMMIHPMHLHGMHMTVIDKDGWPLPAPYRCDTLNVAPGERWDVIVNCNNPGTWAFHCHILPHAESEHGMLGMVTALVVQK
ncbi:MAG: multicopper oxidase type 3 [Gemmatimonadetes bacterium]|nr:multicopper oxidase type 3 [Gemmatimonadota bacterium]